MKTVRTMGFVSTPLELILISGGKVASFVTIVVKDDITHNVSPLLLNLVKKSPP